MNANAISSHIEGTVNTSFKNGEFKAIFLELASRFLLLSVPCGDSDGQARCNDFMAVTVRALSATHLVNLAELRFRGFEAAGESRLVLCLVH